MNLHLPESLGGPRALGVRRDARRRELNWGCSGIGTSIGANGFGAARSDRRHREQKREWLAPLVSEPILGCFGLSSPAPARTSRDPDHGVRKGDAYVVNGSKMFITNAGQASWIVCFASTDRRRGTGAHGAS
jgi:acyl-CoA dehydrogenase